MALITGLFPDVLFISKQIEDRQLQFNISVNGVFFYFVLNSFEAYCRGECIFSWIFSATDELGTIYSTLQFRIYLRIFHSLFISACQISRTILNNTFVL